jgi:hypothetical protein
VSATNFFLDNAAPFPQALQKRRKNSTSLMISNKSFLKFLFIALVKGGVQIGFFLFFKIKYG